MEASQRCVCRNADTDRLCAFESDYASLSVLHQQLSDQEKKAGTWAVQYFGTGEEAYRHHDVLGESVPLLCGGSWGNCSGIAVFQVDFSSF